MEEEVLNTLVVFNTGSMLGSLGGYVLEEEWGEVDGFIGGSTKVV